MTRPSKIDRLPEARAKVEELRGQGLTIDEIMAALRELFPDADLPGRSALGAHIQGLDAMIERVHLSRAVANAVMKPLSREPESRQMRLNTEVLQFLLLKLMTAIGDADADGQVPFDGKEARLLARTLRDIAATREIDTRTTLALADRAELRAAAADEAAGKTEAADFQIPEAKR